VLALLLWVKQAVVSAVLAWAGVDYAPAQHTPPAPPPPPAVMAAPSVGAGPGEPNCTVQTRRLVVIDEGGRRTVITSSSSPACSTRPMFDISCGEY